MKTLQTQFKILKLNQKGQFLIEAVLLMIVMASLTILLTSKLREMDYVKKLVAGPWPYLAGVIENGVWMASDQSRSLHPNHKDRNVSFFGDRQ